MSETWQELIACREALAVSRDSIDRLCAALELIAAPVAAGVFTEETGKELGREFSRRLVLAQRALLGEDVRRTNEAPSDNTP